MCTVQSTGASIINVDLSRWYILPCSARHLARASRGLRAAPCHPQSPPGAIGHWSHSALSPGSHKDNYLRSQSLAMTRAEGTRCRVQSVRVQSWQRSRQQWRLVQNVKRRGCTVTIQPLRNFLNYSQQWHFQSHHTLKIQDLKWWDLVILTAASSDFEQIRKYYL